MKLNETGENPLTARVGKEVYLRLRSLILEWSQVKPDNLLVDTICIARTWYHSA